MSEFSYLADRIAAQQIRERVETARRSHVPGRPHGRHALAARLHGLANRLDS